MKKLFLSLLSAVGLTRNEVADHPIETVDPRTILFSVPTISDDLAILEQVLVPLQDSSLELHEDYWCQVEFFPNERLPELQRILCEYKVFEAMNRTPSGWKDVYARRIERLPVLEAVNALERLEMLLNAKTGPGPVLHSSTAVMGRVTDGFSIPIGGNIHLYGYREGSGIIVLGASVGKDPDHNSLTTAFAKLNQGLGLVLVDWQTQMVLVGLDDAGGIQVWRP